jgi:ATP-dependent DNA helicase PIF1
MWSACSNDQSEESKALTDSLAAVNKDLVKQLNERDQLIKSFMEGFNEIQLNLEEVKNKQLVLEKFMKNSVVPEEIQLCLGAQVMLTSNLDIDSGLVNGSRGVVTSYNSEAGELKVKMLNNTEYTFNKHEYVIEEDDKVMYKMYQYPFILAYALSIHKVQGCTLDYAVIDLGHSIFEENMAYVALSRVRNLQGLYLQNFQSYKIFASKQALEFYENIKNIIEEPGI